MFDRRLNACVNTVDPKTCVCAPLQVPEISVTVPLQTPDFTTTCNGDEFYKTGWSGMEQATFKEKPPGCDNNCKGDFTGEFTSTGTVHMCGTSKSLTLTGKYNQKDTYCPTCDGASCQQTCAADPSCRERSASAGGGVGGEKIYRAKRYGKGFVACVLKGTVSADLEVKLTSSAPIAQPADAGCGLTCDDCLSTETKVTTSMGLSGDCKVGPPPPPKELPKPPKPDHGVVGQGAASFKATFTGGLKGQGGNTCTNQTCGTAKGEIEGKWRVGGEISYRFLKTKIDCGGTYSICGDNPIGPATCNSTCSCDGNTCSAIKADHYSCTSEPGFTLP